MTRAIVPWFLFAATAGGLVAVLLAREPARAPSPGPAAGAEGVEAQVAALKDEVAALRTAIEGLRPSRGDSAPGLAVATPSVPTPRPFTESAAAPSGGAPPPTPGTTRVAPPSVPPRVPATSPDAKRAASAQVDGWKGDVLQIADPGRREAGLVAFEGAIRTGDAALASAALRSLYALRDAAYDKSRLREAVRSRLDDGDPDVRSAAAYALMNVVPDDSDAERFLHAAEAHPDEAGPLIVGAWLAKGRVEGRLAALYVRRLGSADVNVAMNAANDLRGMWVTAEVEDAVLAAWRSARGQWSGPWHILGQIQPTREPRVRMIFEVLKEDRSDAPQLLDRALEERNLEPAAKPVAASLAAESLATAPNAMIRRLCLKVLRQVGTSEQETALRAYAANTMVAEDLRRAAEEVADVVARRR